MPKKILTFAFLFLIVIFQVSFLANFFPAQVVPDLALVILIFLAARRGFAESWKMAVVAGVVMDIFSFYPLGVNVIALMIVVLAVTFLARIFLVTHLAWRFLMLICLVMVGTILNELSLLVLEKFMLNLQKIDSYKMSWVNLNFGLKILYNSLIFSLAYWPLKKYERWKDFYSQREILKSNVG